MAFYFTTPIDQPMVNGGGGEILQPGAHLLREDELRNSWFTNHGLRWNNDNVRLPEPPNATLLRIRGTDIPEFAYFKNTNTHRPKRKGHGTLLIANMNTDGTCKNVTGFWGGPQANVDNGNFRFSIQLDTQVPSLAMDYKIRKSGIVISHRVVIHGNKKLRDVVFYNPESVKSGNLGINIPEAHRQAAKDGRLLAITVDLGKTSAWERAANCVTVLHGSYGDSTGQNYNRWASNSAMIDDLMDKSKCSGFDFAIGPMYYAHDIRLVLMREIHFDDDVSTCMLRFQPEYTYWVQIMKLSIQYGPFWYYAMQPRFAPRADGASLAKWQVAKASPPVPFWCIKQAQVNVVETKNAEGRTITRIECIKPIDWAPIVWDPASLGPQEEQLPHPDIGPYLHELSLISGLGGPATRGLATQAPPARKRSRH